jgi:predicted acyltransferase
VRLAAALALAAAVLLAGCARETSRLAPELKQRLESEGIVHRADNVRFRRSHDVGRYGAGWREGMASIIVTSQSVIIHRNEKVFLEINPRSRRFLEVRRDGDRVRIRSGSGGSSEVWSFQPPDSADAWTKDIRAVIAASASGRRAKD